MPDNTPKFHVELLITGIFSLQWIDDQLSVIRIHVKESMENKTTAKELFTNVKYRKAIYIVGGNSTRFYFKPS